MANNVIARGLASQLLASLSMLKDCIDRCPEKEWNERHQDYPFSQVVFHALFDCEYHLCDSVEDLKGQPFHRDNRKAFADYEELDDAAPRRLHDLDFILKYYEHCRLKVASEIETKSDAELQVPNSDVRRNMTKLERYANTIRHVQHHAAQLGLRLQLLNGEEMEWVSRGYEG